jgi:hypothetical protein
LWVIWAQLGWETYDTSAYQAVHTESYASLNKSQQNICYTMFPCLGN